MLQLKKIKTMKTNTSIRAQKIQKETNKKENFKNFILLLDDVKCVSARAQFETICFFFQTKQKMCFHFYPIYFPKLCSLLIAVLMFPSKFKLQVKECF
jgi:hypothetical protein